MKLFYRHIAYILLLLLTLCFSSCNKKTIPTEILDFKINYENSDEQLQNLARLADSCTKFYANDPVFLEKKAQIFYLKGRNEYKKNNYLNAAESFIEAYNTEKSFVELKNESDNDDIHFLGQILETLGDVYFDINSLKPSSYFYDLSLNQYENASRHHEVIDILLKIGDLYQQNHISNIALLNYEIAEGKKNLTEEQYNIIQIKKGIALYDIFDINSADSLYRKISTKSLQSIDALYFTACHFYYHNNFGKALPYLLKCFDEGNTKMRVNVSEMLASAYFSLNDHDKELYYAQYQAKAQSAEARLTPIKMELDKVYEYFIDANNPKNADKSNGFSGLVWILITVIVILIIGAIWFYQYTKRNTPDDTTTVETIPETQFHSFDDNYNTFVNSKIYKDIKSSLEGKEILIKTVSDYPRLALTKVKIVTLTTKFNESFPNLTHTLSELYPDLTASDFRFIIFSVMGFSDLEIAVLLRQTYGSANKRSNRIKSILHTEEELEHYIPNYLRTLRY